MSFSIEVKKKKPAPTSKEIVNAVSNSYLI